MSIPAQSGHAERDRDAMTKESKFLDQAVEDVLRFYLEDDSTDPYLYLDRALLPALVSTLVEKVAANLQLREEWTFSWPETLTVDGNPGYGVTCSSYEEAATEADMSYMTVMSRLVGPWVRAQRQRAHSAR